MIRKIKTIIYNIIFSILLISCAKGGTTQHLNPCASEDIDEFIIAMNDIANRFGEASLLKENTSPEELERIIKEMQALEQELSVINTPSCALHTKAALENYLSSEIQCYFDIYAAEALGKTSSNDISWCDLAADQLKYYEAQMGALKKE